MQEQISILVVDDEQIMRDGCSRILSKDGWSVMTAENGAQGLDQIQKHLEKIGVILLDLMMPGMSHAGWLFSDPVKRRLVGHDG